MSCKFGALACLEIENWSIEFSLLREKKTDPIWAVFMGGMIDPEEAATKLTKPSPLKPYPPHLHHVLTRCHSCQGWGTSGRHTPAKDIQNDKWKKFKSVQSIVQSPNQLVNTIESPVIFVQKKSADWLYAIMPWILVKPQKLHLSQSCWYPRCFFWGSRSAQSTPGINPEDGTSSMNGKLRITQICKASKHLYCYARLYDTQ